MYDGSASASVTLSADRVAGDVFSDSYTSAAFNNKNVGTAKPVSVSGISIRSEERREGKESRTRSTTAHLKERALTVSATGVNKEYDGTSAATVTLTDDR